MKIAFNPSTVAALITPPNNKDITFDLRGRNIFARGVKFCGTDTWRDIKINNVSIGSNILDLRNGSNTTLTNTNGVVTINSTWRPVVDNLTSDSTTSSLSANLGRVLAGLIGTLSTNISNLYALRDGSNATGRWRGGLACLDVRNTNYTPHDLNMGLELHFFNNNTNNLKDGGEYNGVFSFRQWLSGSDWSGGKAHLLSFTDNGNIWHRTSSGDDSWGTWKKLAYFTDIPSSLKNPHALTISLNGTSQGPYDGSAAKSINITPSSIGAATSGHNHDSSYVKYTKVTKSTADNANATPYLYNVENEEVISGYYKYWYIFNMGQYSGGNFGTLIAMPYQDSLTDSELFIRSAKSGSWRTWRRILHSNNYASILDSRYYTESEVNNLLSKKLNTSDFNWTNLPDKIVAGNEFNIVNAGFNSEMWFNYLPINDRSKTATITNYYFGNGHRGYASVTASGFVKDGSSSSYVLLGDGGHQTISSLSVNHALFADYIRKNELPTPANNTVKAYKDSLVKFFENYPYGIGANVSVSASIISNWSNDAATYFDSSAYSVIKIGGSYNGTIYGQFLLSSYNLSQVGIVGRNNNKWSQIKWLAYEDQIPTDNNQLANGAGYITSAGSCAYAKSAGNADTVDGYHVAAFNDNPWGYIPAINLQGYMDIGKHLEFHYDNTTGSDYSTILRCTGNYANIVNLPSESGTLALTNNVLTFSNTANYLSANFNNPDFSKKAASKYIECLDGAGGWWNWMAGKFMKAGSSDSYVLLGGGGHKLISDFATSNHTHSNYVTALSTNGNYLTWTKNGSTNNITVPYATTSSYLTNGFSATYTNKWDCNAPDRVVYSDYGSSGRSIANAPSGWLYGTLLELGHTNYRGINGTLNILLMWDVAHNTTLPGTLWFRGKDLVKGWAKSWAKVITDLNISSILSNYYTKSETDGKYVTLTTTLTIGGSKTFTTGIKFNVNNNGDANLGSGDGFKLFYNQTSGSNFPGNYYNVASFITGYTGFLLACYGGDDLSLKYRHREDNGTWHPWKTLAFTTDIPTSLKSPYSLTLKANGTTLAVYDGSSAKEANFTYANVGAASASHTHTYIVAEDLRAKYPGLILDPQRMKLSFLAASTLGIKNDGSYYDVITVRSYTDLSGGSDNALLFSKNSNSLYHTRFAFGSTSSWGSPLLIIDSGNIGSQSVASATKLTTGRKIWGQSFDGTANVSGSLSNTGTITASAAATYDIGSNALDYRNGYFQWIGAKSNTNLRLAANNSDNQIVLHTNGNVGIGTNAPAYKLHVAGDIYTTTGFKKNGSSDSYVLLGGGGHKPLSELGSGSYLPYNGWWSSGSGLDVNDANGMIFAYASHKNSPFSSYWGIITTFDYTYNSIYKFLLATNCYSNAMYYRSRSNERGGWASWALVIDSGNIGSLTVDKSYHLRVNRSVSTNNTWSTWYWIGQSGQPTWLWGCNDGANCYVWNPSNFSVKYATSAGSVSNSLNIFGVSYNGSAAKTVTTSTFVSLLSEGTDTVTDGTMFITSVVSNSGFSDTSAVNVPYKRKASCLWNYIDSKVSSKYLPLAGGTMNGNARIGHSSGNLYIGSADNNGWVMTQDIASQSGTDKWYIKTSGASCFGNIHIASKTDGSFNSSIIECNSTINLNYFSSLNVSLCNGGGTVQIGSYTTGDTGNNKLYVNGSEFIDGASNVRNHVFADGFRHRSHNSNDSVLLAGGGYSQGVPVKYWSIEQIIINSSEAVYHQNRGGNYTFITKIESYINGACTLTLQFPSGYDSYNTMIWAMGRTNNSSPSDSANIYATIIYLSGSKYRLVLADDSTLNNGSCHLYFMCF